MLRWQRSLGGLLLFPTQVDAFEAAQHQSIKTKLNEFKDGDDWKAEPQAQHAADVGCKLRGLKWNKYNSYGGDARRGR